MPSPALTVSAAPLSTVVADALVIGTRPDADGAVAVVGIDDPALTGLADTLRMLGHTGAVDETVRVPAPEGVAAASLLAVGLGRGEQTPEALRTAAGTAARA
ncbi:MAG: leucyl aminopeptidase, partial [Yonghaparkia sp.]|nr:leucyl aminopeptidase [Microcella sp.]